MTQEISNFWRGNVQAISQRFFVVPSGRFMFSMPHVFAISEILGNRKNGECQAESAAL